MTPTLNIPGTVISAHDGDTLTVELTIRANVRLRDCWAPELSEPGGIESRDELVRLAVGQDAVLAIPLSEANSLGDLFSFGRVLGDVTVKGQTESIARQMVQAKRASTKKGGALGR